MPIRILSDIKDVFGQKGTNLQIIKNVGFPVPEGILLPHQGIVYDEEVMMLSFKKSIGKNHFSVRSSPITSMPGVLATIVNAGWDYKNNLDECLTQDSFDFFKDYSFIAEGVEHFRFQILDKKISDKLVLWQEYNDLFESRTGKSFPKTIEEQAICCVRAIHNSFHSPKAQKYRKAMNVTDDGCGVIVQRMVHGDLNEHSGSGVLFTRNVITGADEPYGEYLKCSKCMDIVDGKGEAGDIAELKIHLPHIYEDLIRLGNKCEHIFSGVQDLEFVVENGRLYILQVREAEFSSGAACVLSRQLTDEGIISLSDMQTKFADVVNKKREVFSGDLFATGEIISEGQIKGRLAVSPQEGAALHQKGEKVIAVLDDYYMMNIDALMRASGVIVVGGGKTSHFAVMIKKLGIPCVALTNKVKLTTDGAITLGSKKIRTADMIAIDGENVIKL